MCGCGVRIFGMPMACLDLRCGWLQFLSLPIHFDFISPISFVAVLVVVGSRFVDNVDAF